MKVILKKDHSELGKRGEVVSVKDGYAMNFLIPNHIAMKANESNTRVYEELKRQQAKKIQNSSAPSLQSLRLKLK